MSATAENLQKYYRFQARIYDATRWSFLFGRGRILDEAARRLKPRRILEVGCGTGTNLVEMARRFPEAQITGMDLSTDMLEKARKKVDQYGGRVKLIAGAYGQVEAGGEGFDLILFSYCLSMVNPGFEELMKLAVEGLQVGGALAIVDFHDTPFSWFRRWMGVNHVRFDGQIVEALGRMALKLELCQVREAYLGVWRYVLFVGVRQ